MDSSPVTVYESANDGTLYLPNAIASSSVSSLSSSQDEHSSRMRSHKGNKPSLPQSKHCPLCPAKFTGTTHLNRNLRTRVFLSESMHVHNLTYYQIPKNGSIVVTYVIPNIVLCLCLVSPSDMSLRVYP